MIYLSLLNITMSRLIAIRNAAVTNHPRKLYMIHDFVFSEIFFRIKLYCKDPDRYAPIAVAGTIPHSGASVTYLAKMSYARKGMKSPIIKNQHQFNDIENCLLNTSHCIKPTPSPIPRAIAACPSHLILSNPAEMSNKIITPNTQPIPLKRIHLLYEKFVCVSINF